MEPASKIIIDSLNRVDLDLRKGLYSNILLSGGSTLCRGKCISSPCPRFAALTLRRASSLYPGFGDRVLSEVKRLAPQKDVKLKIYAPPERKVSSIGTVEMYPD